MPINVIISVEVSNITMQVQYLIKMQQNKETINIKSTSTLHV